MALKGLKQELSCEYGYNKKLEGLQVIIEATDFCRLSERENLFVHL